MIEWILAVAAIVLGLPGALTSVNLTTLTAASLFYREPELGDVPPVRFLVLIPAHNEELVIRPTLEAIQADRRPRDQVVLIADRCTDRTAEIAREFGVSVLERGPDEEPGRAAARQAGLEYAAGLDWDAIVMIDADSRIAAGFFDACERMLSTGAVALQARSEAAIDDRLVSQATLASFALQGVTMPQGRDRLGLLVRLRGTGMVLRRDICEQFQFRGAASEDLWYSMDLCLAGHHPRHVESARLRSDNVGTWKGASKQKQRYEAGRMAAAREFIGPLLRRHDPASMEAAWYLASPPFAIGVASLLAGALLAWLSGSTWLTVTMLVLTGLLALDLVIALVKARAPGRTWLALLIAPWYLAWKVVVQILALGRVLRRQDHFDATARDE